MGILENAIATVMRGAVYAYRYVLQPLFPAGGCRFHPTCSEYALDAIAAHGPWRGGRLAVTRILRCHPWGGAGLDPVPDAEGAGRGRIAG